MDTLDNIIKKINSVSELPPEEPKNGEQPAPFQMIDIWENNRLARKQESETPRPKGAPSLVLTSVAEMIKDRLLRPYKKAKSDSEYLENQGEMERAKLVRDQYMEERFLPVVESLVMFCSPDEVMNAKSALELLDKYVLSKSGGSGFTYAYLKAAYGNQLGKDNRNLSDPTVKQEVVKIKKYCDNGQNRMAVALAKRLKDRIQRGEQIASSEDWDVILRVATF